MKICCFFVIAAFSFLPVHAQQFRLLSPDKKTEADINFSNGFSYSVSHNGTELISASPIGMNFRGRSVQLKNGKLSKKETSVNQVVHPVVAEKRKAIEDHYNEL